MAKKKPKKRAKARRSVRQATSPKPAPLERGARGDILAGNLEALQGRRSDLGALAATPPDASRVRIEPAGPSSHNLFLRTAEGVEVACYGGDAHEGADPEREVEEMWAGADLHGVSLLVLVGLGHGLELERLLSMPGHQIKELGRS